FSMPAYRNLDYSGMASFFLMIRHVFPKEEIGFALLTDIDDIEIVAHLPFRPTQAVNDSL
ncbi:MAG TPA: hypothetical protein VNI77_09035, partial [Nitrososphaera sp.]|nr:hypothetical protein [Nitrososphaera sp.]